MSQADAMERRKPLEKRVENAGPGANGNQKPMPQNARPSSDETTLA